MTFKRGQLNLPLVPGAGTIWCKRELWNFIMPWRMRAVLVQLKDDREEMIGLLRATADMLEETIRKKGE